MNRQNGHLACQGNNEIPHSVFHLHLLGYLQRRINIGNRKQVTCSRFLPVCNFPALCGGVMLIVAMLIQFPLLTKMIKKAQFIGNVPELGGRFHALTESR
jgi:hypothetical protein